MSWSSPLTAYSTFTFFYLFTTTRSNCTRASPDSSEEGHETERESPMPLDSVDSVDDVEQREPVRLDDDDEEVVNEDDDCWDVVDIRVS